MLRLDIITPEKQALSEEVDSLVAPAVDGLVGILPGHTPYLTKLGVGELRLKKGNDTHTFAVAGGFLEVQQGNHVSVFAETAELSHDIDEERAKLAAEKAKAQLEKATDITGAELAELEMTLSRAVTRLKVAQYKRTQKPPPGYR